MSHHTKHIIVANMNVKLCIVDPLRFAR